MAWKACNRVLIIRTSRGHTTLGFAGSAKSESSSPSAPSMLCPSHGTKEIWKGLVLCRKGKKVRKKKRAMGRDKERVRETEGEGDR